MFSWGLRVLILAPCVNTVMRETSARGKQSPRYWISLLLWKPGNGLPSGITNYVLYFAAICTIPRYVNLKGKIYQHTQKYYLRHYIKWCVSGQHPQHFDSCSTRWHVYIFLSHVRIVQHDFYRDFKGVIHIASSCLFHENMLHFAELWKFISFNKPQQSTLCIYTYLMHWMYILIWMVVELFGDTWWRHQMETFSALLAHCEGNSPVTGEFPSQRPVTRSFDVFSDRRLE